MKKREIALYVILTIVTCGIFGFIWLAFLANDLKELSNEQDKMGGGLVVLLSIVTCGIFMYVWFYQAGKSVEKARYMRNMSTDSATGIIYLVLAFFGLSIVSMGLIQNEINNMLYVQPMNDGSGFGFNTQNMYGSSQPYDNQNYYNTNTNYNPNDYNNYNNPNQGYNQNNYNDPNNTNN